MTRILTFAALLCLANATAVFAQESRGVIYNFTATWCGPCQQMAPIVERLQREGLPIHKIDHDQHPDLVQKFKITGIPTFVLIVDGKEVGRQSGPMSEGQLRGLVAKIPSTTTPAPAVQPNTNPVFPVNLGESAPLIRSTPAPQKSPANETRVAEVEPKKDFMGRLSLGRKDKSSDADLVVRGNDSLLGQAQPFPGTSTTSTDPANVNRESQFTDNPMQSTVRIKVFQNGVIEYGTGTLITSEPGFSRILSCGHIFKNFSDDSRIEVDVFEHGKPTPYNARMIAFNELPDLGLISIENKLPLKVSRIAPVQRIPVKYEKVSSIGCSQGREPTREQIQVNDVDIFKGPSTYLCSGAPEKGRSGGGLFNARGEIIGVCSSCDKEGKQGLYDGLVAIHSVLKQNSLQNLYEAEPDVQLAAGQAAEPSTVTPAEFETASNVFAQEQQYELMPVADAKAAPAKSVQMPMDVSSGDAEVVVFIRKPDPAQNRVVIIHQASPKFLSYLNGELPDGLGSKSLLGTNEQSVKPAKNQFTPTNSSQVQTPKKYTRSSKAE